MDSSENSDSSVSESDLDIEHEQLGVDLEQEPPHRDPEQRGDVNHFFIRIVRIGSDEW